MNLVEEREASTKRGKRKRERTKETRHHINHTHRFWSRETNSLFRDLPLQGTRVKRRHTSASNLVKVLTVGTGASPMHKLKGTRKSSGKEKGQTNITTHSFWSRETNSLPWDLPFQRTRTKQVTVVPYSGRSLFREG